MDSFPKITLLMPSYNQVSYLESAIKSVLGQHYPNLEFMIFDGGSTDGSRDIIQQYVHDVYYWQSQPDKGQSDALIQGFSRASGDLLGWLNSDDVLLPGALHKVARASQEFPQGGLFAGNLVWIDHNDRILRCKRHPPQANFFARRGVFVISQPGSFFKHDDYLAVGGLNANLRFVMDADLYIRMMARGTKHIHVNAWLSGFRLQDASKTIAESVRFAQEFEQTRIQYWPTMKPSKAWKILYKLWQVANGNFLRMGAETIVLRHKPWREWAKEIEAPAEPDD
jgi:glycosyltransferase involved in cell wall biosynthesis